jgi:hypothetical protein
MWIKSEKHRSLEIWLWPQLEEEFLSAGWHTTPVSFGHEKISE